MTARRGIVAIAAIGAAVSLYLTWVHYAGDLALCIGVGGCEAVQTSRFAVVGPVPVAAIGLAGFLALLGLGLWRALRDAPPWTATALFGMAVAGTLYAAYLTYVELAVLGQVCPWCVSVALAIAAILALVVSDLRSG